MAFKNGAYATLWNIDKNNQKLINFYEKYAEISISTSKKGQNDRYETDFTGRIRCYNKALEVLKSVKLLEKDKVKLLSVEVNNKYDNVRKKLYTNFVCWDLELVENAEKRPVQEPEMVGDLPPIDEVNSDDLPF